MTVKAWRAPLLACALLLATGCGSGSGPQSNSPLDPPSHLTAGFAVDVLPAGFIGDSSLDNCSVTLTPAGTDTLATISVTGADSLRALLCDVTYDATAFTPLAVTTSPLLGAAAEVLELTHLTEPGTVHLGQVLVHPLAQPGFSGDGVVATIRFAPTPFSGSRSASAAPVNAASAIALGDTPAGALTWYHTCQGDYDQNGLVSAADLVPIALYYEDAVSPEQFPVNDARSQVDGDSNGTINISDITFVGMNFGNSILGGYNVYVSAAAEDYPTDHTGPNGSGAVLLGNHPLQDIDPGEPINVRRYYEFAVVAPTAASYYWVRPVDADGNEGTPSGLLTELGVRVPRNDLSRSPARLDAANNTLGWYYYNAGDLNVDGTVRLTDITVMGQHYDPIGPYHPNSQAGILDVNHDQVQNEGDADLVVKYLGNAIAGYNVYRSSNSDDYPASNKAESIIAKVGFVAFSNMHSAWEDDDYRPYYVYNTTDLNQYHWVRPVDDLGNEGTPSILQHPLLPDAHVPLSGSSITFPVWDAQTNVCKWYYYNAGDYNQDSLVTTTDLGVIGMHFGNTGPFDANSLDAVIDGNRDELISELDIDLVGKYYNNQVDGYNVYLSSSAADYAFGSTNPSTIAPIATIDFYDFLGSPGIERTWFEYLIPAETPGYYLWVRPFNGDGLEGIASRLILRID